MQGERDAIVGRGLCHGARHEERLGDAEQHSRAASAPSPSDTGYDLVHAHMVALAA